MHFDREIIKRKPDACLALLVDSHIDLVHKRTLTEIQVNHISHVREVLEQSVLLQHESCQEIKYLAQVLKGALSHKRVSVPRFLIGLVIFLNNMFSGIQNGCHKLLVFEQLTLLNDMLDYSQQNFGQLVATIRRQVSLCQAHTQEDAASRLELLDVSLAALMFVLSGIDKIVGEHYDI